jgi:DNA-binding transcriptional ArsR family regulator
VAQDKLPNDVQNLIANHITAVEQLEILLFLRQRPDLERSAKTVSEEIRTSELSARSRLMDLRDRGLLTSREDDGVLLFRLDPATEELRRSTAKLAEAYASRRYTVIDLIFSKPIDRLRVYADAFRLNKGDPDG